MAWVREVTDRFDDRDETLPSSSSTCRLRDLERDERLELAREEQRELATLSTSSSYLASIHLGQAVINIIQDDDMAGEFVVLQNQQKQTGT